MQRQFQTHVGHQGTDDTALETTVAQGIPCDDIEHFITVDEIAGMVNHDQTVTVTIKGNPQISLALQHLGNQCVRRSRTNTIVDVETIRGTAHGDHFSTQLAENRRRNVVSSAMTAVHHHFHPIQIHVGGEGALAEFDIATGGIINAHRFAKFGRLDTLELVIQLGFDSQLDIIGQLGAVGGEELDAVVVIGVVGCTDDDAGFGTEGASQVGNRRGGHGSHQYGFETGGGEPRLQCRLQHVTGDTGILADQHLLGPFLGEHLAGGPAEFHDEIRGDRVFTHLAAHAVGAEVLSGHCLFLVFLFGYEILSRHGHPACTQDIHGGPHVVHPDDPGAMLQPDQGTGQTTSQPLGYRAVKQVAYHRLS